MSQTLTLTGVGNTISARYFPAIRLDSQQEYVLGLVGFYGVHSIRNIGNNNDKFYYGNGKVIDIGKMLGFSPGIYSGGETHKSDLPVLIFETTDVHIHCSITTGAYLNEKPSHTLFELDINVEPDYKLVKEPVNIIYLPITTNIINELTITLTDQHQRLIDLGDFPVTVRLELKPKSGD